jgi:hypothetical protein
VKIAIVVLPAHDTSATLPLALSYVAAWLEQQRHIVRVHDLALHSKETPSEHYEAVRAFRPNMILIAADDALQAAEVRYSLADLSCTVITLGSTMRNLVPADAATLVLNHLAQIPPADEHSFILDALFALRGQLDDLPLPARHLLPIERYTLTAPSQELQTNVLIGQHVDGQLLLRNPRQLVSELRSIGHESGIWHVLFEGVSITEDLVWLHDFLYGLMMVRLGISWEATATFASLTPELLRECRRAGCEGLRIEFDAMRVLESQSTRQALHALVREARILGLRVSGNVMVEPRYSSLAALVDVSTTFGLSEVQFSVHPASAEAARPTLDLVNRHYRTLKRRQVFIDRFGAYLGPMLWRVGRMGLLGRAWQRVAFDEGSS